MNLHRSAVRCVVGLAIIVWSTGLWAQTSASVSAFEAAFDRGYRMQLQGRLPEAIAHYEQALRLLPEALSAPNSESLLRNLGSLYTGTSRLPAAQQVYTALVELTTGRYGRDDPRTLKARLGLMLVAVQMADFDSAWDQLTDLVDSNAKVYGRRSREVAELLEQQALIANHRQRKKQAMSLLVESIEILEELGGPRDSGLVTKLASLALFETDRGLFADAERSMARALAIAQQMNDATTRDFKLGMLYITWSEMALRTGHFADAEAAYRGMLAISEKHARLRPSLPSMAVDLGSLYCRMGLLDKSQAVLEQSAEYARKYGVQSPNYRVMLASALGRLYTARRQYDDAEKALLLARQLNAERHGPPDEMSEALLDNLAVVYIKMDRDAEAEQALREVLALVKARLPADHPHLADEQKQLAWCLYRQGKLAEARELAERALAIYRAKFEAGHPDQVMLLAKLSCIAVAQQRWADAIELEDESRRGSLRYVSEVLPELASGEQLQFLYEEDAWNLMRGLSMSVARPDDLALRTRAAEWLLNAKGVAQQALAKRVVESRTLGDPRASQALARLHVVRRQLIHLRGKAAETDHAGDELSTLLGDLAAEEARLGTEIARLSGNPVRSDPWVSVAELQKHLEPGSVFVELSMLGRFRIDGRGSKEPDIEYVAWIVPQTGDVRLVNLGAAEPIDAQIKQVRGLLEKAPRLIAESENAATVEKQLREPLESLSGSILEPITKAIGSAERIELSPDGALWLVPWAALLLPDGRYAVEKYEFRYQISGRELVDAGEPNTASQPLVFADPAFDLRPAEALAATQRVLAGRAAGARSSLSGSKLGLHAERLEGTAREAKAIEPALEKLTGTTPVVYADHYALEGVFKAVQQPRVLVLSTHGFFFRDQRPAPEPAPNQGLDRAAVPLARSGRPVENPLLRCGLLLAGCNHSVVGSPVDDGILTGLEIAGADLRGTQLVVLSACVTGLGDLHMGEGVAGLRQAFQLAGARSVMATLWSIDDVHTAALMSDLFVRLAAGERTSAALRAAQIERIRALERDTGSAHPFFWAAFTHTGI